MGVEARFQAIPEGCELLARARNDAEVATWLQFINGYDDLGIIEDEKDLLEYPQLAPTPADLYFLNAVRQLIQEHPDLLDRYYYAGSRTWDIIIYLLSPQRRVGEFENDQSLIRKAIWGSERLHPEARATQGHPIGFVPAKEVPVIADFLDSVTYEQLHEHYDPPRMEEMGVYKIHPDDDGKSFQYIWEELVGMRNVYRAAAEHHEAMITVID